MFSRTSIFPQVLIMSFIALFASCGSDDDEGEPLTSFEYMPLTEGNTWNYEVATGSDSSMEEMRVEEEDEASSTYELESNVADPAGVMTSVLTAGTLRLDNNRLLATGSSTFDFQGLQDLEVTVENAPLYDQNMPNGSMLFTASFSDQRVIENFDTNIDYSINIFQLADIPSLEVEGETYSNVIQSLLTINARISTPLGGSAVDFLAAQDVIVVTNYWAEGVGLIRSDSQFSYTLEDLSQFNVNLPIPQSASILTTQNLLDFNVQ